MCTVFPIMPFQYVSAHFTGHGYYLVKLMKCSSSYGVITAESYYYRNDILIS